MRTTMTTIRCFAPLRTLVTAAALAAFVLGASRAALAQDDADVAFSPEELEDLVGPIALYPDELVAIVLPAATYPLDIVEAARFLDEQEQAPDAQPDEDWDDSVVALLNYPEVLRLMDEDLDWTWDLGEAFLTQQSDVLDAIQRFRADARDAGNLVSDERQVVAESEGAIRIEPADPEVIYVPYYEPRRIVVHHHVPIHYYPRPYPVYYYPYPAHHVFHAGFFWGVTSAFVIGWNTHHVHVHHHLHAGHPFHGHRYHAPFYVRQSIGRNFIRIERNTYIWQPRYRHGARPDRVTVVTERSARGHSGIGRHVTRSTEGRASGRRGEAYVRTNETRATGASASRRAEGIGGIRRSAGVTGRGVETRSGEVSRTIRDRLSRTAPVDRGTGNTRLGQDRSAVTRSTEAARSAAPARSTARTRSATPRFAAPTRSGTSTRSTTRSTTSTRSTAPTRSTPSARSAPSARSTAPAREPATRSRLGAPSQSSTRLGAPSQSSTRLGAPSRSSTRLGGPARSSSARITGSARSGNRTSRAAGPRRAVSR